MEQQTQSLSAYERARIAANSVVARNDFNVSDVQYCEGNARSVRLRPPLPDEATGKVAALGRLGFTTFVLLARRDGEAALMKLALIALEPSAADSLAVELARMSDEATLDLLRKPQTRWWPMEG